VASELVRHLPADLVGDILGNIRERHFEKGEVLFEEGAQGNEILFIENGIVAVTTGQKKIAELEAGDVVGEIALLTGDPRTATATAKEATNVFSLSKQYFDECRLKSSEFNEACKELAASRLSELISKKEKGPNYQKWVTERMASLTEISVIPTDMEIKKASEEHGGAPMAIWLGILLDGIPESFVIGSALVISVTAAVAQSGAEAVNLTSMIPYTLIAGLFLANFPEAMSSSIGMKKMGWSSVRVFLMWGSLMVVTSIGASIGYWLGGSLDHSVIVLIEGLAAGAMLAMIASAMIPEAVHLGGGTVTGMSTLFGFLAAISFKLLE
jgi:zinc transporter ZupT